MSKCTCGSASVGSPAHSDWCDVVLPKDVVDFIEELDKANEALSASIDVRLITHGKLFMDLFQDDDRPKIINFTSE